MTRRVLDDQEILDLLAGLRSLEWPLPMDKAMELPRRFEWTVEYQSETVVELDTGLGLGSGLIDADGNGVVDVLRLSVTSRVDRTSEPDRAWLRDRFAHVLGVMTQALGEPAVKRPGPSPQVRWRGGECTIGLTRTTVNLQLFMARNDYLDEDDRRGEGGR
ncbi:DUF6301 family protein [Actinomadura kijaniata]|uniref:DUF6301 family protein n=1 Tax=Actinomadura kijaniata TaxID=46161 RepID=UPI003F1D5D42